jgi:hypothetical protein
MAGHLFEGLRSADRFLDVAVPASITNIGIGMLLYATPAAAGKFTIS